MEYKVDTCTSVVGLFALVYDITCIPLFVQVLWNHMLPSMVDGVHTITYKQAWMFVMVLSLTKSLVNQIMYERNKDEMRFYMKHLHSQIQQQNNHHVQPFNMV